MAHRPEITGCRPLSTRDRARRKPGPPTSDDPEAIEPSQRADLDAAEIKKLPPIRGPPIPPAVFTVAEFAKAHRISISMFYKLRAAGLAPVEMKVGARRFISFESAARWRAEREAAARDLADV
jgi:hypothetical protein